MENFIAAFASTTLAAAEAQFPKACGTCSRRYAGLSEYLRGTQPLGQPRFDPDEDDDGAVGALLFSNCSCGSTLAITIEDSKQHRAFNLAVRECAAASATSEDTVLERFVQRALNGDGVRARTVAVTPPDELMLRTGASIVDMLRQREIRLPAYPQIALNIRRLAAEERAGSQELAALVSHDQALAVAVLRLANSPLFRRGEPVTALAAAITRVGAAEIERLALATSLFADPGPRGIFAVLRRMLWHRSVVAAVIARALGAARGLSPEESFTAGLLHNLGSVVLSNNIERTESRATPFPDRPLSWWYRLIERFRPDVALLIADKWKLPTSLADAMCAHHSESLWAPRPPLAELVIAADAVAEATSRAAHVDAHVLAGLPLSPDERQQVERLLPECPALIAWLESPAAGPVDQPDAGGVAGRVHVRQRPEMRVKLDRFEDGALVLRASGSLPENYLTQLDIVAQPALTIWARTVRNVALPGGDVEVIVAPFALDAATDARLRTVASAWTPQLSP